MSQGRAPLTRHRRPFGAPEQDLPVSWRPSRLLAGFTWISQESRRNGARPGRFFVISGMEAVQGRAMRDRLVTPAGSRRPTAISTRDEDGSLRQARAGPPVRPVHVIISALLIKPTSLELV